ncbi:aldehyde oxidase and xanthine dehydrogenase molybdopterin binding protein [Fibrella aestuarina BUZ 2]|uniref:Aldehyde oxidase and xanthine dehydrogenase molybdopterin binding protein n=1 Tax=Fibrella aestuarina BUZ 2 TaxID=1166018 RepID=I0K759_9BACT|nr:xanthine dehydrogenase family protein molybdopterin-binding subunit [Fibrella aestuarina]CCG99962.1 aldehyde oxidase and xanthine dehydrogenase molybdopterin binding protein [Fibrella aestuarina BUZ 2]
MSQKTTSSGAGYVARRDVLKTLGLTGAAFVLGTSASNAASVLGTFATPDALPAPVELTPYVIIERTGKITLMNTRPEIGQGTFQSIPALIAEELGVTLDQVTIRQTGGQKAFGWAQFAGGSMSVRTDYLPMRKVGASAREMLVQAAANTWNVPASECTVANARVLHKASNRSLGYGELAEAAAKLPVPTDPKLKDPNDFVILGKDARRPDVPAKSSGKAQFGIDMSVPGMVYASIERSPVFGSKVVSFDDAKTKQIKGVRQVLKAERVLESRRFEGVAVVADTYWAALQGRKALQVRWDHQGHDAFSSAQYEQHLRDLAKTDGLVDHSVGDFAKAIAEAPVQLEAFYETPVVSHSPMEPMNCLVSWTAPDAVEIWTSSQVPGGIKSQLAGEFKISPDNVTVHITFNGGGFGRRLYPDYVLETAHIAKAVGKPVKAIWTREDDTQLGPFRPMTFSAMRAGMSADGKPLAFQHKVISPSLDATLGKPHDGKKVDKTMTEGIGEQKYELPNLESRYVYAESHIPMAAWRAVTSTTLAFAHEGFLDELAHKAGKDPMHYRLSLLTKDSDAKRVLTKLREVSNWDKPLPVGKGRGVAQWEFFAGLAGQVVEVAKQADGSVKVEKVYCVIDLGTVVNPDMVRAQIEGAICMGLVAATKDGITFANGQAQQANFDTNRMLRINEMPKVEVHILADGGPTIKGVGEPGLPPLAPALANAIFAATGKRLRRLPMNLEKIA